MSNAFPLHIKEAPLERHKRKHNGDRGRYGRDVCVTSYHTVLEALDVLERHVHAQEAAKALAQIRGYVIFGEGLDRA